LPILIQFIVCFILLSFMVLVYQQNKYIQNKDLGYDPKNVVLLLQPHLDQRQNLKNLMMRYDEIILKNPLIEKVTRAVYNPGNREYEQWYRVRNIEDEDIIYIPGNTVMYNYFDFYDIQFIAGSSFRENGKGDEIIVSSAILP